MKFFKEYFFYRVPKEEKDNVRQSVLLDDHNAYSYLLLIVMAFQAIMLIISLSRSGINLRNPKVYGYQLLYMLLFIACFFMWLLIKRIYNKGTPLQYFTLVSFSMVALLLWSVGISCLDSMNHANLTTFAYVAMSVSVFITLEPWIVAINVGSVTIFLNIVLAVSPYTTNAYSANILINSISIFLLASVASSFNFYRRIKKINLEIKIRDLNKILEGKTHIDDLTQLLNRRYLTENISTLLRSGEHPTGVMIMDLDHFKNLNDTYGHVVGDVCLSAIGKLLCQSFMPDVSNEGALVDQFVVRYGGEEFLVFFRSTTKEELFEKAEAFRKSVENLVIPISDSKTISLTISIGTAVAEQNSNLAELINRADRSLYKAKETRNTVI